MSPKRSLRIAPELCIAATGCRECVTACPDKVLQIVGGLPQVVGGGACEITEDCVVSCVEDCPTGAARINEECD